MKVIREGVEDNKRWASAFRNVIVVLKRLGFLPGHVSELLEAHPNGIANKFCHDYGSDFDNRSLRSEVERVYGPVSLFIEELARKPLKPVEWLAEDFIPANTVTGFFGDGGTGKDRTLMLLAAAVACNREHWLGKKVKHGRALYYNVEDDEDELNRRQAAIADYYGINFENFPKRLKIVPLVGKDTVLAVFDARAGMVKPTPLFESVRQEIAAFKPTLVIVGNRVNIFSVEQNSDTQARQCVQLLFRLCTEFVGTTVIMPGHVSLEGMRSGRGESGTVQWGNACRARLLLDRVRKEDGGEPDQDARVLQVKKANWGPDKNEIKLRWSQGLFAPDTGDIEPEKEVWKFGDVAALLNDEEEFLRMLDLHKGAKLSPWPTAQNNAAKVFAADSRCKLRGETGRTKLKAAMERLQTKGIIEVIEVGPKSRPTFAICRVERGGVMEFPSGKLASEQPQGNGSEPAIASPQGNGGEADTIASVPFMLTTPQKRELHDVLGYSDEQILHMTPQEGQAIIAQGRKAASERYRVVGDAPAGSACSLCFGIDGGAKMVEDTERDGKAEPLHPDHAKEFYETDEPEPPL